MNPNLLTKLADFLDTVAERVGTAVSWLTLGIVLITFAVVVLRYVFNVGWIAMQESVIYLHAAVFLLGAAYTLKCDRHVRVDIFYRNMSPVSKAWVNLAGVCLLLLPVCVFIVWVSWEYVGNAWELREGSREAGGLPGVYILKAAIPAMAILLAMQGVSQLLRSMAVLFPDDGEL